MRENHQTNNSDPIDHSGTLFSCKPRDIRHSGFIDYADCKAARSAVSTEARNYNERDKLKHHLGVSVAVALRFLARHVTRG